MNLTSINEPSSPVVHRSTETTNLNLNNSKRSLINDLLPSKCEPNESINIETRLMKYPVETLEKLHQELCSGIFTDEISNTYRTNMILCLLKVDQEQWKVLLQQVRFIMPADTREHDVMWATEILSSTNDPILREQLITVTHRLFKYDTSTLDRGYILNGLAQCNSDELYIIDSCEEQIRAQYVATLFLNKGRKEPKPSPIFERGLKV